jgi:hypothetical protein
MRNINRFSLIVLLMTSVSAFAAEVAANVAANVPAVHLLKGGTQYESTLRAAGVPLSIGLNTAR